MSARERDPYQGRSDEAGHQWFTCVRLSDSHLTQSRHAFSFDAHDGRLLTSAAPRWFAARFRKPTAGGLPPSRVHIAGHTKDRWTDTPILRQPGYEL